MPHKSSRRAVYTLDHQTISPGLGHGCNEGKGAADVVVCLSSVQEALASLPVTLDLGCGSLLL